MTQLASSPRRVRRDVDARHQRAPYSPENGPCRGRHATPVGQGFGYLVGWTILGALVPGAGLFAAGRRAAGAMVMGGTVLALAGVGLFVFDNSSKQSLISLAADTSFLLGAAIAAAVVGAIWAVVIVGTHGALRRGAVLSVGQRALAIGLVLSLVGAVAVPAAGATRLALVHRDLLMSIFGDEDPSTATGAKPKVDKVDPWADVPRVNVLLLGGDDGRGRTGVRPDTVILASIDTKTGNTVLFNIPRQLEKAPFPTGSVSQKAWPYGFGPSFGAPQYSCGQTGELCFFNAIWSTAESNPQHFPGVKNPGLFATLQATEGVLGLHVDYYGKLNLKGFEDFVDAIGGITMRVRRDIPVGGGTNQLTGGHNPIYRWIRKGNRHLNGKDALWFARSREGSDNWERMQRQQCVVGALARQAQPVKVAMAYPKLARSAKQNITTNIPRQQIDAWVELAMRVQQGKVTSLPLTPAIIGSAGNPNYERIHYFVNRALRASATKHQPGATATPRPGADATPSAGTRRTPSPSATIDATRPQDINAVC